jgi:thiol:disulfide interchange protein
MKGTKYALTCAAAIALWIVPARAQEVVSVPQTGTVELVRYEAEHSAVSVEPVRLKGRPGLAVVFQGTSDLHYYARAETAPTPELKLSIEATSDRVQFGAAVFPPWNVITDPSGQKVEAYVGDFTVLVPLLDDSVSGTTSKADVTVRISGLACTSKLCLRPFDKTLTTTIDLDPGAAGSLREISFPAAGRQSILAYGTGVYYLLAILAGVSINVMPCVLPVLPLILLRLFEQSRQSHRRRITSGLAFCMGVVLFFAAFALLSAIINLTTGAVLDLNSLFRYPAAVIALFLAIVFFGLVMLDIITLSLPSSVLSRQSTAAGIAGSAGMGFFAGVLSTPCSGALLGFVLVWAQTQPLPVSSTAIVLMGVGMALPYAVIVLVPSLLNRLPKPGHWMEVFKKSAGFLLFFIAVKLTLAALPKDRLLNVLTYGIVFGFCAWMWGKWVDFSTPVAKRWAVRSVAALIALGAGLWLLPTRGLPPQAAINWQPYDARLVRQAVTRKQPVLLDFTADWCTNCKIVSGRIYQDPQIARLLQERDVLPVKADTTLIDYPATRDFKQVYGEAGNVPVSIVLLPDGSQEKLRGIFDKEQLIRILEKLPEARGNGREEELPQNVKDG